jgi:hypothetical protein
MVEAVVVVKEHVGKRWLFNLQSAIPLVASR